MEVDQIDVLRERVMLEIDRKQLVIQPTMSTALINQAELLAQANIKPEPFLKSNIICFMARPDPDDRYPRPRVQHRQAAWWPVVSGLRPWQQPCYGFSYEAVRSKGGIILS